MANDRSSLKTRRRGGWNVVEEPATIAGVESAGGSTSASEVPKVALSISLADVVAAHHDVLGGFKWRQLSEGTIELSEEEKTKLLEAVLGCSPNVENVRNLYNALHVENSTGWTAAGSCPDIVRIAQEFLQKKGVRVEPHQSNAEIQKLLDALNRRDFPGVQQ
jgi:hypothetical protein